VQALALAGLLIVTFPLLKAPVGFAAAPVVVLLIARRAGLIPAQWCASPAV
jgi:hypothetical protein